MLLGRFAIALCDICGQQYKLSQLRKQWNNWKACPECYSPKQPQQLNTPTNTVDPQALYEPRPDMDVEAGTRSCKNGTIPGFVNAKENVIGSSFRFNTLNGSIGTVTVTTT